MFKSHKKKWVRRYFQIDVARTLSSNVCQKKIIIANWTKSVPEGTFSWLYSKGLRCVLSGIKKGVCNIFWWIHDKIHTWFDGYVQNFHIFDHFYLKMNLGKSLLSKWNILKPCIDLIFTASDEDMLSSLYNQIITICKDSNNYVMILIKYMEKIICWATY